MISLIIPSLKNIQVNSLSYSVSEFYILPCLNLIVDQACSNEG
jgi:hypothetical protein